MYILEAVFLFSMSYIASEITGLPYGTLVASVALVRACRAINSK